MLTLFIILIAFAILILGMIKLGTYDNPRLFRIFINQYRRQDKIKFPEPDSILFTGSSVVKFWKTMEQDLSPLYVLNRGIAGTKIHEIAYWTEELVVQYKPKAVVLYAGSNDIQGKNPKTPEHLFHGFTAFSNKIHQSLPGLPVIYLSITPCPAKTRWKHWHEIQKANSLIRDYCENHEAFSYVDTTTNFLDSTGLPDKSFFRKDGIHLNDSGYKIWSSVLRPVLEKL